MPTFQYKAADKTGKTHKGVMEAVSKAQVVRNLGEKGLFPLDIIPSKTIQSTGIKAGQFFRLFSTRVSGEALATTSRQLATLLEADLPLDKALSTILGNNKSAGRLERILAEVLEAIRQGEEFAVALSRYPRVFDATYTAMVRAGENSGTLVIVMESLADHLEQQVALRRKVQSTLAYPVLLLLIGLGVVVFLLTSVIPKVTEIFDKMEKDLPLPTIILIGFKDFIFKYWFVLFIAIVGVLFGGMLFSRTRRGRRIIQKNLLRVPVWGEFTRQILVGRFAKTLGVLLEHGVSLIHGLSIAKNVSSNVLMQEVVEKIYTNVESGRSLTLAMEESSLFSHISTQMIAAGEESGRLDKMLLMVARGCENKVNMLLQMFTSLLEPLLILSLGLLVGFVVVAILLPIFQMSNLVG